MLMKTCDTFMNKGSAIAAAVTLTVTGSAIGQPAAPFEAYLVKDIWPGGSGLNAPIAGNDSAQHGMTVIGDTLYFGATREGDIVPDGNSTIRQWHLWKTDGTGAGTQLVAEVDLGIRTPIGNFGDGRLIMGGGATERLSLGGASITRFPRPVITDGTPEGTLQLTTADGQLLQGSSISTRPLYNLPEGIRVLNARTRPDDDDGNTYVTDGTIAGTVPLDRASLNPNGVGISSPQFNINGEFLFEGSSDFIPDRWSIFKSPDGTFANSEVLVQGQRMTFPASFPSPAGDKVVFTDGDIQGGTVWVTDGTAEGTQMIKDLGLNTSIRPSGPSNSRFTAFNGQFYFAADSSATFGIRDLWVTDGTAEGTQIFDVIERGPTTLGNVGPAPSRFTVTDNLMYFVADDGIHGRQLYRTDGTEEGSFRITEIRPSTDQTDNLNRFRSWSGYPPVMTAGEGDLLFFVAEAEDAQSLYMTDGTAEGTEVLFSLDGFTTTNQRLHITDLTLMGDTLFFVAPLEFDGSTASQYELHAMIIPEPGTIALLCLGGLTMLARRRRATAA
jgi:ELWxxDGT repeat protein